MGKIVKTALFGAAAGVLFASGAGGLFALGAGATATAGSVAASVGLGLSWTAASALAGAVVGTGLSVLSSALSPSLDSLSQQAGSKLAVTSTIDTRKIVYGAQRIAGTQIFIEEYDSNGSDDVPNDTLVFARVVSDSEINSFGDFYIGDTVIAFDAFGNATTSPYTDKLYLKTYDGSQTSGAASWITEADSDWDSAHVGEGCAYYVVKAIFDPEVFPYGAGELLNCSIEVQGKKIYDPRLDSTQTEISGSGSHRIDDASTWAYSTNPALCIYDYLLDARLGNPVPSNEMDVTTIAAAANTCDESVSVNGGGTIDRYTLNGVVDSANTKLKNLDTMLTAMGGRRMWMGGLLQIFAAESVTSSVSLGDADIFDATYHPLLPTGSRFNEVRGTFIDASNGYETMEYPAQADTTAQATEGEVAFQLNLPYTQDHRIAQRLAKIKLKEARQPTISAVCKPAASVLAPQDVVSITSTSLDLSSEPFRVTQQAIDPASGRVTLELIKEDSSIYSWTAATDERDLSEGSVLSQPTGLATLNPSNVTVTAAKLTSLGGIETAVLEISWDDPGPTVSTTLIDYRENGDTIWKPYGSSFRGDNNHTVILPEDTTWDVRVTHVMRSGLKSATPHVETATTTDSTNVSDAITNFNSRNDRDGSAITNPTIATNGSAVDHVISDDSSADISFEWSWSGDENDIDGFVVYARQSTSGSSYNFGNSPDEEKTYILPPDRRALFLYGVPANKHYTFGVRAFRKVDQDVAASGLIQSSLVQCTRSEEDPYRPSSSVAFSGDLTGTIDGGRLDAGDVNIWTYVNGRNRIAAKLNFRPANSSDNNQLIAFYGFSEDDGVSLDMSEPATLIKTNGSEFTWGGNSSDSNTVYMSGVSNGVYYLVLDTSGSNSFTHSGTVSRKVGACRNLGASTLQYLKALTGWVTLSWDSDFYVIGLVERRRGKFVNVEFFPPCQVDEAPEIFSSVGIDLPEDLPIESIAGVYTLDPSNPCQGYDDGSDARIDISSTTLYYGDSDVDYNSGSVSNLSFSTGYHVYAVDDNISGGSVTYQVTTDRTALPSRAIYFGYCTTPANGGSSTGGTQGGYAGGGGSYDPGYSIP